MPSRPENHFLLRLGLSLLFALAAAACAFAPPPSAPVPLPSPEPMPLRVVRLPFLGQAPLFIAEEEGYFAEQGLQIEFIELTSGAEALAALFSGEIDIVFSSIGIGLLNGIARGGQARLVMPTSTWSAAGCPSAGMLVRRDRLEAGEFADLAQVKGMKLATNPIGMEGFYIDKALAEVGLGLDDLVVEDLPPPALADALAKGAVDLVHASEPWVTRLTADGGAAMLLPARDVLPDSNLSAVVYGPTVLGDKREAGTRFAVAFLKAVRQYHEGKTPRNIAILSRATGLDPQLLERLCLTFIPPDGRFNQQGVLDFQAWAFQKGLLDRQLDPTGLFDPRFADEARQILGITP